MTTQAPPHTGDWLDAALASAGAEHRATHVDDDGFVMRVMDALPAASALPAWRSRAIALLWGVAGIGVAFALPGVFVDTAREVFRLIGGQAVSVSGLVAAIVAVTAGTWAATAYALRND